MTASPLGLYAEAVSKILLLETMPQPTPVYMPWPTCYMGFWSGEGEEGEKSRPSQGAGWVEAIMGGHDAPKVGGLDTTPSGRQTDLKLSRESTSARMCCGCAHGLGLQGSRLCVHQREET